MIDHGHNLTSICLRRHEFLLAVVDMLQSKRKFREIKHVLSLDKVM